MKSPMSAVRRLRVDAMVGDLWTADPATQLWIALAERSGDPMTVGAEDAFLSIERDPNVAVAVLFVQGAGERVHDAVHDVLRADAPVPTLTATSSFTHSPSSVCNQRIFDS